MSSTASEDILQRLSGLLTSGGVLLDALTDRDVLICQLMMQSRRLGALSTLYSMSTADHLGMNLSDMLCLGILSSAGPITAGQLASMIGLSTGSVTGLIDRLERLDLVRRERDVEDRRRIVIHLNAGRAEQMSHAFIPMLEASWEYFKQFTDEDLSLISRYLSGTIQFMQIATEEMRARPRSAFAETADEP